MSRNEELAAAFFRATAAGDGDGIRALCSPELRAVQNGGPPMDAEALAGFATAVRAVVPDFRYEEVRRAATGNGFVEEHAVRGTLPDGSLLDLPACVVADVEDGRILALREYLDGYAARPLIRALRDAG